MKNLKKLLALVVACVMVFGMVASAAVIEFPDVASNAKYAEAVKVLSGLNIINGDDKGNFNPDQNITRAEMAKVLCAMMVKDATFGQTDSGFADVTAAHWASGYVKYAKGLGYINGYDATTYGPEDNVTYEQAIKLIVAATGWGLAADANGGYPSGYMMIAADKNITKNVVITDASAPAKRSDIAIMAFNALTVDMMKREVYGTVAEYKKSGETLLGSKLGAWKYTGRITDSYVINPDDYKEADGEVKFDGPTVFNYDAQGNVIGSYQPADGKFICTDPTAADYLGYKNVTAYFVENADGDDVIVAVTTKASKVTEYVFDDMALLANATDGLVNNAGSATGEGNDMNFAEGRFTYWTTADHDDKRPTILKVDNDYALDANGNVVLDAGLPVWAGAVWYVNDVEVNVLPATISANGVAPLSVGYPANGIPAIGSIKAYDTDGDDRIDLFKATKYDVAVVDSVNPKTLRIRFKGMDAVNTYGSSTIALNEDKFEFLKDIKVTIDGEAAEIADLQENDVIYMYGNNAYGPDMTEFEIIAARKAVSGKAMTGVDTYDKITIGEEEMSVFNDGTNTVSISFGDEGTFFLTPDGEIAAKDANVVTSKKYAYIYKIGADAFGTYKIRMLTSEGADVTYDLAEKIEINGVAAVDNNGDKSASNPYSNADLAKIFGLVTDLNNDGKINDADALLVADIDESTLISSKANGAAITPEDIFAAIEAGTLRNNRATSPANKARENKLIAYDEVAGTITKLFLHDNADYGAMEASSLSWKNGMFVAQNTSAGYMLASGAKIFMINSNDIADWKVVDASALVADRTYPVAFFGQDVKTAEYGVALAAVSSGNYDYAANLAFFKKAVQTVYGADEEVAYKVTFIQGGEEKVMYVLRDKAQAAAVEFVDNDTTGDFAAGTAFIYEVGDDTATIESIAKLMDPITDSDANSDGLYDLKDAIIAGQGTAGTAVDTAKAQLGTFIGTGLPTDKHYNDFMFTLDGRNTDNVVEFGIIGAVKAVDGGLEVTLATPAGKIKSSSFKYVVGEDANVVVLNYIKKKADNQLYVGTLDSIQPSNCKLGADGFDFANIAAAEKAETFFQYALIRMYNDKVVDVLIINHESTDL